MALRFVDQVCKSSKRERRLSATACCRIGWINYLEVEKGSQRPRGFNYLSANKMFLRRWSNVVGHAVKSGSP